MGLIGMMSEPIVQMGPMPLRDGPGGGDRRTGRPMPSRVSRALAATGIYLLRGLPSSFSELRVSAPRACPSH